MVVAEVACGGDAASELQCATPRRAMRVQVEQRGQQGLARAVDSEGICGQRHGVRLQGGDAPAEHDDGLWRRKRAAAGIEYLHMPEGEGLRVGVFGVARQLRQ